MKKPLKKIQQGLNLSSIGVLSTFESDQAGSLSFQTLPSLSKLLFNSQPLLNTVRHAMAVGVLKAITGVGR